MIRALTLMAAALPAVAAAGARADCGAGLDRALQVMESRAPMKDEVATALMWLRLDAAAAIEAGDVATCRKKLAVIENVLNIEPYAAWLSRQH